MRSPTVGLERVSAGHIVLHELRECLLRVQHDQVATPLGVVHVEHPSLELVEDRPRNAPRWR